MRALVTADLHLNDNPRDAYRHKFMEGLPALVKKHKAKEVFILGDLTDEKDRHSAWLVNKVVGYIEGLARECFVVIVQGNHDYLGDPNNPFFGFTSLFDNVLWVSQPKDWEDALFLPHTNNHRRDWANLKMGKRQFIFAHNAFVGADLGHGQRIGADAGIPIEAFPKGSTVIAGDIHIPQTFGPLTYVGAPYTVDFGDDYAPRALTLNTWNNSAGEGHDIISIPLTGPQKRLIEIESIDDLRIKPKGLQSGDILKIRINLKPEDHANWAHIAGTARQWCEHNGYIAAAVQPIMETYVPGEQLGRAVVSFKTDEQLLKHYAKQRGIPEPTLKTGLRILDNS